MATDARTLALQLLRRSLDNPQADFRPGQWSAIEQLLQPDNRLLVVQRTGWGKSVVYFLTTKLLRERGAGPTLLVSPLLALMRNQIAAAQKIGIRAATINSNNREAWDVTKEQVLNEQVDILLISPERLANQDFRDSVLFPMATRIGFVVIDEAHCISDWGHDFRPDYRRIVRILQALPKTIPVLATTATANDRVINDVISQLGRELQVIKGSLIRNSLRLQNTNIPNQAARLAWLTEHLHKLPGSGIIYALTTRDAQQVSDWLNSQGISARAYSSKSKEREKLEELLLSDDIKALVATSALGMGYDKPNLGFVVHYQRPGSVVHYYQQVGRAGRALDEAYGIMLSGAEDEDITNYFIRSAFPPEGHITEVLAALESSENGLSVAQIEQKVNLPKGKIDKVLKILSVETPSPIAKIERKWYATPVEYRLDTEKVARLLNIRKQEQKRMSDYADSETCLMNFLAAELDNPQSSPCGQCAVCIGRPLVSETVSPEIVKRAVQFLRRTDQVIEPRKRWPTNAQFRNGWKGAIGRNKAEPGRALCMWNDAGWGNLVKQGKYRTRRFDDELVQAAFDMIHRWQPHPYPTWLTCVTSLAHPYLVPDFAQRLAQKLEISFRSCVIKTSDTPPQKEMNNSYRQARNVDGAFEIRNWERMAEPVFLVDDMVDSRWTFTVVAALLREAGSGPVFPLALSVSSPSSNN